MGREETLNCPFKECNFTGEKDGMQSKLEIVNCPFKDLPSLENDDLLGEGEIKNVWYLY